ncbi:MAG TPA: ATP-binding protein [Nitrospirota bacterium]|nr:ATP-binding protein [Nitrospirota bacterium]
MINYVGDLLSMNYKEPLLRYVVFQLDDIESGHSTTNRKRLISLTFFALIAVASVSVVGQFIMPATKELFFVDASKHATLEMFCGLISGIIAFILTWEYHLSGKKNILLLVFAFFSTGILDIFHAFSDYDHIAFVWFHSSGALLGSVFLAGSAFLNRKMGDPVKSSWARSGFVASGIVLIVVFALLTMRMDEIIPNVLSMKPLHKASAVEVRGQFSNLIYAVNFISCLLYLLVGIVFVKGFLKTNDVIYLIFGTAALLFFESELLFAFSKLWDPLWWYWHIIKVMVFSALLIGLAYGFTHTVYRLHESRIKLANFLREIEKKNYEVRDAYDRLKETQKYLQESEKLASLGKMAAMVAHEIRNPLGAISNSLGALKRYSSLGRDDLELIGIVEKEMDRLNNMTEDFLSFSRPSRLKREPIDIHPLIEETISLLRNGGSGWSEVRIEQLFAPDVPRLMLDKNRFRQILLNLLINARQAIPEGGQVSVSTRFKGSENEVEITIADTGVGMSEDVLSQAFQPFFTTKDSGLGLGLNIVHKIVKEHGGYVLLSSTPGEGTHVQINFPVPGKDEASSENEKAREYTRQDRSGE